MEQSASPSSAHLVDDLALTVDLRMRVVSHRQVAVNDHVSGLRASRFLPIGCAEHAEPSSRAASAGRSDFSHREFLLLISGSVLPVLFAVHCSASGRSAPKDCERRIAKSAYPQLAGKSAPWSGISGTYARNSGFPFIRKLCYAIIRSRRRVCHALSTKLILIFSAMMLSACWFLQLCSKHLRHGANALQRRLP